jgi:uncharacterized membrane protein
MAASPTPPASSGGLDQNVAGLLAYVTFIPAIIFLVVEPYSRNKFIRFHAFQSIFFNVAWFVLWMVVNILVWVPGVNLAMFLVVPVLAIAGLILWVVLLIKAYGGSKWKLPIIGDLAEKQAG